MQINTTTNHALLCMVALAENEKMISARAIEETTGVSRNYVIYIMKKMCEANLADSVRGTSGGFFLAKPATDITIYDIFSAMENMNVCKGFKKEALSNTNVKGLYSALQENVNHTTKGITLAQVTA